MIGGGTHGREPMFGIRRREFITLLGGAAVAWPLAARAQQAERVRWVGVITGTGVDADDADMKARFGVFAQALEQLGWSQGRNVQIDYRFGSGNPDDIRRHAVELAALAPDVILSSGAASVSPTLQATRTIPVVFVSVVDPVGPASPIAWRSRAAMPPALSCWNTA